MYPPPPKIHIGNFNKKTLFIPELEREFGYGKGKEAIRNLQPIRAIMKRVISYTFISYTTFGLTLWCSLEMRKGLGEMKKKARKETDF